MKMHGLPWILLLIPALLGCGGTLEKKELFAAYGEDGTPMYYRITIKARGYNGDVQYRAGWFDADAVDSLFGDLATHASIQADLVKKQREAVSGLLIKYFAALNDDAATEELVARRKQAFEQSLAVLTGVTPAGAPKTAAIDYAGKKFVIILSNKPDEIVAAVKGQVQKKDLLNAVGAALSAKAEVAITGSLESHVFVARLESASAGLGVARDALAAKVSGDKATNADVSALLSRIQAEAESLP